MILPLFPTVLEHYKENDANGYYEKVANTTQRLGHFIGSPQGQSETVLIGGILGSVFCFLQFISAPLIGAFSDLKGRRQALLICLVGIATSHVLWYNASTFLVFILSRIIGGLARANVSLSTAIVADDCTADERPKGMAMIGGAFSIGFVVGPAIGAYFSTSGDYSSAAVSCVSLSAISLSVVYLFLPETLPTKDRVKVKDLQSISTYLSPRSLFSFKAVSVGQNLKPIGISYFIYIFIYSGLEFTLTFLTHYKFKYTPMDQGKMFAAMGLGMALLQGTLVRRLTPAMEDSAAKIGMLIMIPAFAIIGYSQDSSQLALGLFCYCIGSGVVTPCLTSMTAARVTKPSEKGVALGIFRSLGALARAFGPLSASALFWRIGPSQAYLCGALTFVIPLYFLSRATKN
ncbi:unnamed protein product [Allacma fusca]|uniref:Major facilitator superfamily (MFS) profile domain-containing protein n=1 Tax=Allacma fusca TaxID=39272 RepID=A0A8J2JJ01_9HEXA|nr:unnamed protein product [Allacma fusca]